MAAAVGSGWAWKDVGRVGTRPRDFHTGRLFSARTLEVRRRRSSQIPIEIHKQGSCRRVRCCPGVSRRCRVLKTLTWTCRCFFFPPALVLLYLLTDDTPFLLQVNDSSSVPLVSFFLIFFNSYEYVQVDLRAAEIDRKLEGEFPVLL